MPITTVILAFGMLIGVGSATNISIKLGQGNRKEAEKIVGNATSMLIILGIFLTIIGIVFANPLLRSFGATDQTIVYAKEFIEIILIGTIYRHSNQPQSNNLYWTTHLCIHRKKHLHIDHLVFNTRFSTKSVIICFIF